MAKKIKVSRKKIKKPDEFITTTDRVIKYLIANKNLGYAIIGAVVLVVLVLGLLNYSIKSRKHNQGVLLAEVSTILKTPLITELNEDEIARGAKFYSSSEERNESAIAKLNEIAKRFSGSGTGLYARYQLAGLYLEKGDADQAIASYQDCLDQLKKRNLTNHSLEYSAYLGMAKAYFLKQEYEKASEFYQKIINSKPSPEPYLAEAMLGEARAFIKLGDFDQAGELINQLNSKYPGSVYSQLAQLELARISKK